MKYQIIQEMEPSLPETLADAEPYEAYEVESFGLMDVVAWRDQTGSVVALATHTAPKGVIYAADEFSGRELKPVRHLGPAPRFEFENGRLYPLQNDSEGEPLPSTLAECECGIVYETASGVHAWKTPNGGIMVDEDGIIHSVEWGDVDSFYPRKRIGKAPAILIANN